MFEPKKTRALSVKECQERDIEKLTGLTLVGITQETNESILIGRSKEHVLNGAARLARKGIKSYILPLTKEEF